MARSFFSKKRNGVDALVGLARCVAIGMTISLTTFTVLTIKYGYDIHVRFKIPDSHKVQCRWRRSVWPLHYCIPNVCLGNEVVGLLRRQKKECWHNRSRGGQEWGCCWGCLQEVAAVTIQGFNVETGMNQTTAPHPSDMSAHGAAAAQSSEGQPLTCKGYSL